MIANKAINTHEMLEQEVWTSGRVGAIRRRLCDIVQAVIGHYSRYRPKRL